MTCYGNWNQPITEVNKGNVFKHNIFLRWKWGSYSWNRTRIGKVWITWGKVKRIVKIMPRSRSSSNHLYPFFLFVTRSVEIYWISFLHDIVGKDTKRKQCGQQRKQRRCRVKWKQNWWKGKLRYLSEFSEHKAAVIWPKYFR